MTVLRIISGGQTGADQGGLHVARDLGIPTGGTAPKGWRTERGPAPWLADYGLVEDTHSGYHHRTGVNVERSDGTVVFQDVESPGSRLTIQACQLWERPYIVNPSGPELRAWIEANNIETLNIAGNRDSKAPGITGIVHRVLSEALKL